MITFLLSIFIMLICFGIGAYAVYYNDSNSFFFKLGLIISIMSALGLIGIISKWVMLE